MPKNHKQRKAEYEALTEYAVEFLASKGLELTSRQKRMLRGLVYNETFDAATKADKTLVLSMAAVFYIESVNDKKES